MSAWWIATQHRGRWVAFTSLAMMLGSNGGPLLGRQPVADVVWQPVSQAARPAALAARVAGGGATVMQFNKTAFDAFMNAAPDELAMRAGPPLVLSLPLPDGAFSRFTIAESPVIAPALAAAYPEIRTFTGQGIDDPTATTRFGWTAAGFHAIVVAASGTTYIDPVAPDNRELYLVAAKASRPQPENPFICLLNGTGAEVGQRNAGEFPITNGTSLRTYRLAVAATGEYTTAAGGTKAAALARMVTTMNRVNGIYERELAVRMTLSTGTAGDPTALIFTNGATDPYSNDDGFAMLDENQAHITAVIGAAGYDVGHVFSTGGGGVAALQSPCDASVKAQGVTGSPSPTGDAFDVDYVAHEMGHQFGGNHTFNGTSNACGGGNRSTSHAYEVGSGSTIQAYAGICSPENLQPNSNDYFTFESLNEMTAFITNATTGASCGTASATGNTLPTAGTTAAFTIPASTPFTLTATGADGNGDALTYAWEEFNLGTASSSVATASTDNGSRPLFRSYSPSTSPSRTFPSLTYILNNANAPPTTYACSLGTCLTGEVLPSTARTMNFQVTVRDNRAAGGGINTAATAITVSTAAGPFQVTSPNTAVSLPGGTAQTVTWNVAGTSGAPVSTANVRIMLSTDGGTTFGAELAASTPNDGTESVILPNLTTTAARIKVEAVGNVFFDISNTNFSITAQQYQASLSGAQQVPAVASPGTGFGTVNLNLAETEITVNLSFSGLTSAANAAHIHGAAAAGANAGVLFDFTGVTPAATSGSIPQQTFAITPAQVLDLKAGLYYFNVHTTINGGGEIRGQIAATTTATAPGAPTNVSGVSGNGQVSVSFTTPSSNGGAAITGYTATASPGGATGTGTGSPIVVSGLINGTAYTFTVTATNSVGTSLASSASAAVTPATVPGAPTGVIGVSGNAQVSVGFTAPASNGGAAITAYTVTASPGGATGTGTGSPIVVSGLTNGTAYTFTVTATNSAGTGAASSASAAVTPIVPTITGAPATLAFAATKNGAGGAIVSVTAPQSVAVTYAGGAAPSWTATANQPWVLVTNGTGTGTGTFTVAISDAGNVIAGSTSLSATITIAASSPTRTSTVALSLTVKQDGASALPFGSFDTPVAGAAVDGSIAVTGWALDDIEVAKVEIWRDRVAGETTPVYPGPGPGTGKIYIADPVFVTGARADVEGLYPTLPLANRAGWGYLLLTQGLWAQGNGPFTLYAFAYDREGRSVVLGSKAITVSNATATRPFGSIDVPAYGQTMTTSFFNFGWALTPNPNSADSRTCTITNGNVFVAIDSGALTPVSYGDLRTDIAGAFPGFSNGTGAGGAYYIDTTSLANGTHQIGWYVVDNCNRAEGIGSRFFTVLNSAADSTAARSTAADSTATDVALRTPVTQGTLGTPGTLSLSIEVRRGLETTLVYPSPSGTRIVAIGQSERVEVHLPAIDAATYAGYQVVNGERRALPLGSSLDAAQGIFYWQPAAGFLGAHDLEFESSLGGAVRVRAVVGTSVQAVIDTPQPGVVAASFTVAGWAIEQAAASGTGIDTVHVWAYPDTGEDPLFLGVANYGDARLDIGALFGSQFTGSSYSLPVDGLAPGAYTIVVYPHSAVIGDFRGAQVVRVIVRS